MAYVSGSLNMATSNLEGTFKEWTYLTTDSEATVKGSGYISDATKKGMLKGDIVMVVNQTTPAAYILQVASVTAGAATLAASVVVT